MSIITVASFIFVWESSVIILPVDPILIPMPEPLTCSESVEALAEDRDSRVAQGADETVAMPNHAKTECGATDTVYESRLVHRLPSEARQYRIVDTIIPDAVPKTDSE